MSTNSFNPLNYTGVEAVRPADEIRAQRAPTAADRRYKIGTIWYDQVASTVWKLTQAHGGSATWTALGTGAVGGIVTLSGDGVIPVPPVGGDLAILGTAAQGVTSTEGAGSITLSVLDATTVQKGVAETSTDAETIAGASATVAVTPASLAAKLGVQTDHGLLVGSGAAAAVTPLAVATDGQLIIGSTGADPVPATLGGLAGLTATAGAGSLSLDLSESIARTADITVSAAEIVALAAAPKELVAAPVAGKALQFLGAIISNDFDGAAYDAPTAAGDDLAVIYAGGAQCSTTLEATGFINTAADLSKTLVPTTADTTVTTAALQLSNIGANEYTNPGAAAGVLRVRVLYRIVTTGL